MILIVVGLTFLRVDGPALDEQKGLDFPSTGWLGLGSSLHEVGIEMLVRCQIASPPDDQRHHESDSARLVKSRQPPEQEVSSQASEIDDESDGEREGRLAAERLAALLSPQADDESFPGAVCSSMSVHRDITGAGRRGP